MADAPATRPSGLLFSEVIGQPSAVAQLAAVAARPVHAYLLEGPPGSGKRAAAVAFSAALLCPSGGCGTLRHLSPGPRRRPPGCHRR